MKYLLLSVLFTGVLLSNSVKYDLQHLNKKQKAFVTFIKEHKSTKLDKKYVLSIAWKESKFGLYRSSKKDGKYGSYGWFHNLLETVMKREGVKNTKFNRFVLMTKLKYNLSFSFKQFEKEIKFWLKGRELKRAIKMYNCGYSKCSNNYVNSIYKLAPLMEKYVLK